MSKDVNRITLQEAQSIREHLIALLETGTSQGDIIQAGNGSFSKADIDNFKRGRSGTQRVSPKVSQICRTLKKHFGATGQTASAKSSTEDKLPIDFLVKACRDVEVCQSINIAGYYLGVAQTSWGWVYIALEVCSVGGQMGAGIIFGRASHGSTGAGDPLFGVVIALGEEFLVIMKASSLSDSRVQDSAITMRCRAFLCERDRGVQIVGNVSVVGGSEHIDLAGKFIAARVRTISSNEPGHNMWNIYQREKRKLFGDWYPTIGKNTLEVGLKDVCGHLDYAVPYGFWADIAEAYLGGEMSSAEFIDSEVSRGRRRSKKRLPRPAPLPPYTD